MPESNNREAAEAGIYVTESQLAGALEAFRLSVVAPSGTFDLGVELSREVDGEVADPDKVACVLYSTLVRMAELRDSGTPSRWPSTRGELETRLSVALRRIPVLAWKGDIEDDAGHGSGFALVTPHDPAALAGVLADDIAGQCVHGEPAEAPLPETDAAAPWPMSLHAQLAAALAATGIVFRWLDLPQFADGEAEFTVKAAHPGKLAGQLLRAMSGPADQPAAWSEDDAPGWPMGRTQMAELLTEALRETEILIHGSSVTPLSDGEYAKVKAEYPAELAAALLGVIDSHRVPAPPEPPRLAHADQDDELIAIKTILEALSALGDHNAVLDVQAYVNGRIVRRELP